MSKHAPLSVYQTLMHPDGQSVAPVYLIEDGLFYRTVNHPLGGADWPDYQLRPDGFIYRTPFHELGTCVDPDYSFRKNGFLYRTGVHPEGPMMLPVYEIRDFAGKRMGTGS